MLKVVMLQLLGYHLMQAQATDLVQDLAHKVFGKLQDI
jgi:hypothetical protein